MGHAATPGRTTLTLTSSPMRKPPASSAVFQLNPKSLRLRVTSVSKPILSRPQWIFPRAEVGHRQRQPFVTPCIVRSPTMSYVSAFRFVMRLLLNVMVLNFSTAKKSSDRRCLSRSASLVSMLAARIVTSIVASPDSPHRTESCRRNRRSVPALS